ncbi:MAG: hypothetical protein ACI9GW_000779 [Halieaceae bacterium]|jgi:hypothetical protein
MNSLNWDAIGALAEVVGAVGVIFSLLYLALQIRTQNVQAKLTARHEIASGLRQASGVYAMDDLTEIFVRANENYDAISEAESVRLIVVTTNLFRAWEEAFLTQKDGHLGVDMWVVISRDYTQTMGASSMRHIWSIRKGNYDPDFQKYVDGLDSQQYISR